MDKKCQSTITKILPNPAAGRRGNNKNMPTYKNISNQTQVVHNVVFNPLDEKEVEFYIYDEKKFKKISDEPTFSPVSFSQTLSSGSSLKIEDHLEEIQQANQIRIAGKEPSKVSFNNTEYSILVSDHPEFIKPIHIINEIKCEEGEVSVEFWRPANWRN